MPGTKKPIVKSGGITSTERLLAQLCERTFHRLWSWPNPFKDDGKELCDLLVVFDNHVFIFFDRESRRFDRADREMLVTWERWKREAVDKQIVTARGAERYLRSGRAVYMDAKGAEPFPLEIPQNAQIHKFVVAHGAKEACEAFSDSNVYGSLAIWYGRTGENLPWPFRIPLKGDDIIHVLDSHNVEILFSTLDTLFDLSRYVVEKERAIREYDCLAYCGEEDLIAHYLLNYDSDEKRYRIGPRDGDYNYIMVGEGEWRDFIAMPQYQNRIKANEVSYSWDRLIEITSQNALDGTLQGDADLLRGESAIRAMAREPRVSRRALAERMHQAICNFPQTSEPLFRHLSFMSSFYEDVGYVFLQIKCDEKGDYETEYRPKRQAMLEIACGSARNKFPHLTKIIGIAIDAPKYAERNSEDFLLMQCETWTDERAALYREANKHLGFFESSTLRRTELRTTDFPVVVASGQRKTGRNHPCPCGSGKKYKRCCLGRI